MAFDNCSNIAIHNTFKYIDVLGLAMDWAKQEATEHFRAASAASRVRLKTRVPDCTATRLSLVFGSGPPSIRIWSPCMLGGPSSIPFSFFAFVARLSPASRMSLLCRRYPCLGCKSRSACRCQQDGPDIVNQSLCPSPGPDGISTSRLPCHVCCMDHSFQLWLISAGCIC